MVMVHPALTYDPENMRGEMGTISHVDMEKDEVLVRFKDQFSSLYSTDALLMLIPGNMILDKLRQDADEIEADDWLDILGIYMLDAATLNEPRQRAALDLAMSRPNLRLATVITVQDWIDLNLDNGHDLEPGRGR